MITQDATTRDEFGAVQRFVSIFPLMATGRTTVGNDHQWDLALELEIDPDEGGFLIDLPSAGTCVDLPPPVIPFVMLDGPPPGR
jgi:hypothetical protein